ncbi:MAG: hypothetical protein SchgKO_17260 [Schleiferiaceae bacterium]
MKKLTTLFFALAIGVTAFGQERTKISSAKIALDKGRLEEAKNYIDEAGAIIDEKGGTDVDDKQMSKYLYFKGEIYRRMFNSKDEAIKAMVPNGIKTAADSYLALLKFEQTHKQRYTDEANDQLPYAISQYTNTAFDYIEKEDYNNAYLVFINVYKMKQDPARGENAVVDTATYSNAAVMALNGKNLAEAVEIYEDLVSMKYKGITYTAVSVANDNPIQFPSKAAMENGIEKGLYKDGVVGPDQLPSFYVQLYSLYTQMEQPEKAEDAINRGIAMYPDNMDLLNTKIQTYLDKEDFEGALGALEAAAEKNPDNQLYFFNIGLIYQNTMNDLDKAMASFDRAIAIDSAYYDALYSKGVIYSNMSNDIVAEMNELPLNAKSKYKKLKAQKLDLDKQSVYWLEKAYEVKPEAVEVITALSKMYRTVGENEKALEMIQKLQSMETAE